MPSALRQVFAIVGPEYKVLLLVVAGLITGELGMRCFQDRLSVDVGHLQSFLERSNDLENDPIHPHVLFLGNSMTRYGVSPEEFTREFALQTGRVPATMKINPDNTHVADWYYVYRNFFFELGHAPDVLVLGFEGGHLRDQRTNHPGRLAQYYCDLNDWAKICKYDCPTVEDQAMFLLCSVSAMCSNRDRLQRRLLDNIIPGYRDGSQTLNVKQSRLADAKMPAPTYHRLKEFLEMTRQQHVTVVLAAMPVAAEYELDPQLLNLLEEQQVQLLDCRHIPGIVQEMFPDGVHMTSDASQIYSRFLADELAIAQNVRHTTDVRATPKARHSVIH